MQNRYNFVKYEIKINGVKKSKSQEKCLPQLSIIDTIETAVSHSIHVLQFDEKSQIEDKKYSKCRNVHILCILCVTSEYWEQAYEVGHFAYSIKTFRCMKSDICFYASMHAKSIMLLSHGRFPIVFICAMLEYMFLWKNNDTFISMHKCEMKCSCKESHKA